MSKKKVSAFSVYQKKKRDGEEKEEGELDGTMDHSMTESTASGTSRTDDSGEDRGEGRKEIGKKRRKEGAKHPPKKRKVTAQGNDQGEEEPIRKGTKKWKKALKKEQKKAAKALKASKKKTKTKTGKKARHVASAEEEKDGGGEEGEEEEEEEEEGEGVGGEEMGQSESDGEPSLALDTASPQQVEVTSGEGGRLAVPFFCQFDPDSYKDSRVAGRELFQMVISPMSLERFYREIWEQSPLLLRRHKPHYNDGWFSTSELDRILRENDLEFTTNIDITSYEDGKRLTHNLEGRALAPVVWDFFTDGCSVRLLNPQTYSHSMWLLTSTLQEHFHSFVGANIYLTPANTQGFAPHSDDIEAFVLQLEGKKHWRLYSPRELSEVLPRCSSRNLSQDELGEPILDVVLEPGDVLYFPRGTFHQADSLHECHSLHVTLSTYQKYTWGDVLTKLVPAALDVAMQEDVEFRKGLPLGCLDYMGRINSDREDPRRDEFLSKIGSCVSKLIQYSAVDEVMDQIAAENVHGSLPPCLSKGEAAGTANGSGAAWKDGKVDQGLVFTPDTEVKLVRYNAVRLVVEEDGPILYYNQQNSKVFQGKPIQGISIDSEDAELVEHLIQSYPNYIKIKELPLETGGNHEKIELCYSMYCQGVILAK